MTRVLVVTGGRDFADSLRVGRVLRAEHERASIALLVHGGASGADRLCATWARAAGLEVMAVNVTKAIDGPWPGAGPRRNARMLTTACGVAKGRGIPCEVLAFPGGRGTADCVRQARAAGLAILLA